MPVRGLNWLTNANMTFPVNSEYKKYPNFDILFSHPTTRRHEIFQTFMTQSIKIKNHFPFLLVVIIIL